MMHLLHLDKGLFVSEPHQRILRINQESIMDINQI
jgi:hypothetical protein